MTFSNSYRRQPRPYSMFIRSSIGVLGAALALTACGNASTPGGGDDGGGSGGGPNTEQQGKWTDRGVIADGGYDFRFAVSADGKKIVGGITSGHIYTSSDLDQPWIDRSSGDVEGPFMWQAFASSSNGESVSALVQDSSQNKLIFTSINSGVSWTNQTPKSGDGSGNLKWQDIASSSDGTKLVAVVASGHVYRSIDSGKSWKDITPASGVAAGDLNWNKVVTSANGLKYFASTSESYFGFSRFLSFDESEGGWHELTPINTDNKSSAIAISSISASSDAKTIVVAGLYFSLDSNSGHVNSFDAKALISMDSGVNWKVITPQKLTNADFMKTFSAGQYYTLSTTCSSDCSRIAMSVTGQGTPTNLLFTSSTTGASWYLQELKPFAPGVTNGFYYGIASSSDGRIINVLQAEIPTNSLYKVVSQFRMLSLIFP